MAIVPIGIIVVRMRQMKTVISQKNGGDVSGLLDSNFESSLFQLWNNLFETSENDSRSALLLSTKRNHF